MIGISTRLHRLRFGDKEFRRDLEERITHIMLIGMVKWVRMVAPEIPVQTGMAKSSLQGLADWLNSQKGLGRVAFDISPKKLSTATRSRTLGRAQSAKSPYLQVFRNQYGPFLYRFNWWTNVEHYIINESLSPEKGRKLGLIQPTPWNTLPPANEMFSAYINSQITNVPQIENYIFEE